MGRPYYAEYVQHALRFYSRNLERPTFNNDTDKSNWLSCHSVLSKYTERDREILTAIYAGFDTLSDEVYGVSRRYNIHQNLLWDMMKELERKVASRRGLI